jgi:hypothetical protein
LETVNLEEFASESPTIRIFVERPRKFLHLVSLFVNGTKMSRAASMLKLNGYFKENVIFEYVKICDSLFKAGTI